MKHRVVALVGAVAVACVLPSSPLEAQGLGGLKKRVKAAVGAEEKTESPSQQEIGGSRDPNHPVVLLDEAVLARVRHGLTSERAERAAVDRELAKVPTREVYEPCAAQVQMSPEGMKLFEEFNAAIEGRENDLQAIQRAQEEMQRKLDAMVEGACGPSPELFVERVAELERRPEAAGAKAAGLTEQQYGVAKERIVPFCKAEPGDDGAAKVPGEGSPGVFYTYAAEETAALRAACGELMPLLEAVL